MTTLRRLRSIPAPSEVRPGLSVRVISRYRAQLRCFGRVGQKLARGCLRRW